MKKIALLLMVGFLLAGCSPKMDQESEAMKGYELYTWQEGEQWYFALLEGTNRLKTDEEILSAGTFLNSSEDVRDVLKRLKSGQFVTWMALERFPLPDEPLVQQVEQACQDLGLECSVVR